MRVSPIMATSAFAMKRKVVQPVSSPIEKPQNINFKGGSSLKFGDYLVGAICGTAMAAVGFAVAGPIGAVALGAIGAKSSAEANNETRTED